MTKILLVILSVSLVGCGAVSQLSPEMADVIERRLPFIDPRGGQLCMFRASNFVGAAMSYDIYANNEYIGRLPNSSYFCTNLEPGEYVISTGGTWQRGGSEIIISKGRRKFMELHVGTGGIRVDSVIPDVGLAGIYDAM